MPDPGHRNTTDDRLGLYPRLVVKFWNYVEVHHELQSLLGPSPSGPSYPVYNRDWYRRLKYCTPACDLCKTSTRHRLLQVNPLVLLEAPAAQRVLLFLCGNILKILDSSWMSRLSSHQSNAVLHMKNILYPFHQECNGVFHVASPVPAYRIANHELIPWAPGMRRSPKCLNSPVPECLN
ncbi:hypothetical protein C5167_001087 [Papaver somniferum]|uniref:Uncharacterized protein n=1 Tax=Papaver somniferum TaxID=3469 RepID=A0A4Y7KXN7_PAPSO|nr:hypothetical protein C5167_001087 [Papaver somniferum]